MGGKEEDGGSS
jgi:hypothetical protein